MCMTSLLPAKPASHLPRRPVPCGFTIIEVLVSLGIFTVAVIMAIVMMSNSTQAETAVLDHALAKRIVSTINTKLDSFGYRVVQGAAEGDPPSVGATGLLFGKAQSPDDTNIKNTDVKLLYVSKLGDKIGTYIDPIWGARNDPVSDKQKYFEVMLVRGFDDSASRDSPSGETDPIKLREAASVQFVVRISWPAHDANTGLPVERSQRSAFIYNYALAR